MVTDQEIARCVESVLRGAPPGAAAATVSGVVRQLEAKLGLDLSNKAAFISDQIDLPRGLRDHFAHRPHPQFQPVPHFQIPPAAATSSPFSHLSRHHELAFRFPALPPSSDTAAAAAVQQQFHLQQLAAATAPQPVLTRPEAAVPVVAPSPSPAAAPSLAVASAPKESASTGVKRRGGPGGLSKVCGVSPELQAIVGEPTMARTQIVKQLWAYIRKNNLQDPNNKRKIICNDELRLVFETDCTDMFKMNKLLAKHIIPLEQTKDPVPESKRLKAETTEVVSEIETNAVECPVVISDALTKFFGTEEREMLQSEALRRVWDYIKVNQLEHPMNTMVILCDSKLQELFGCQNISALGMSELLAHHLSKQS